MEKKLEELTKVLDEQVFEAGHRPGDDPRFTCWKVGFDNDAGQRKITHTVIKSKPSVAVIIKKGQQIALIRQFRSTSGQWHIEIPAGLVEVYKGETVLEAAIREAREESGLLVKDVHMLVKGPSLLDPSKSDEDYGVAVATAYGHKNQCLDAMEQIDSKVFWMNEDEVFSRLVSQHYEGKPFMDDLFMSGHSVYALLSYMLRKYYK